MTTKDRTLRFITYKGLSVKKFEEMCGLSNGYINSMKSGFGSNKLSQVLSVFSDLNRDWLVYGEGEMIKNHRVEESLPQEEEQGTFQVQDNVLIAELRSQIEKLEGKIDNLNQELGEKNALIKLLRKGEVESI